MLKTVRSLVFLSLVLVITLGCFSDSFGQPYQRTIAGTVRKNGLPVPNFTFFWVRSANGFTGKAVTTNGAGQYSVTFDNCSVGWPNQSYGARFALETGGLSPHYLRLEGNVCSSLVIDLSLPAGAMDGRRYNAGGTPPYQSVGCPVDVTNGNMWFSHTDYVLPGTVGGINVTRTYNSAINVPGIFGNGWLSDYESRLLIMPSTGNEFLIQLDIGTGRVVDFLQTGAPPTTPPAPPPPYISTGSGLEGNIVVVGTEYELTWKDGRKARFSATGQMLWKKDRIGNQTSFAYDTNNNLTTITEPFGRSLSLSYTTNGRVFQISDSTGTAATYTYDEATGSYLTNVTYADGSQYKYEYVTIGAKTYLATVKDALNNILETHEYDSLGRAFTSEKHGGAEKYTLDFSHWNDTVPYTSVTHRKAAGDPPIETKYYFDKSKGRNLVTKTEGICGCGGSGSEVTTYEYDDKWKLRKKTDALLGETTYTHDSAGNVLTQTDVFGTQRWTYNSFAQVLTYRDRVDSQTSNPVTYTVVNTYNPVGDLLTVTDALGKVTTVEYPETNNKGLPNSIKDARNNITKFKWYASGPQNGLLEEIEDPYTKKTKFTYDARARIKTVTNALNHVSQYNYFDDTQRKVELIYPNLDKITYKYDIRRLLESVTDERGKVTAYEFDPQQRLKKITDPLGHFREFGYDLMSNMTSYKDPLGNITDYRYEEFNRLKEIEYPAATAGATRLLEKFEYDKLGRLKKYFDTANRLTEYGYNEATRTNTVTNAELETTTIKYNQRFQTVEVKDALNQVYTFGYDPLGRLLSQTRAGGTMSFVYDDVGNRTKRFDYMGRETKYTYDNLNRLKEIEYLPTTLFGQNYTPNQKSTYGYDDISRLTSATNEAGTVSFNYDNRNRLKDTTDVFGHFLEYEYQRTSTVNQKRLKLDGALYATYNFDDAERLANIVNASDSTTITYGYDNEDKVISRAYPNGVTTTYDYDNMDRLKRLKDFSSSATLFDRQYAYNTANQIESITEPIGSRLFTYDLVNRLKTVTATANENYSYDDVGNRTLSHLSNTYGYQSNNRMTSTDTATMLYDPNGNTVSKSEGSQFLRFGWDYENRMTMAATRKQTARYRYDALGRRVQRYIAGNWENTKFTYDGHDVLLDDNGGTLTKYLNGEGTDNKLRVQNGSDAKYFLSDHLGSTNGLADSTGAVAASQSYDAFGNGTNANFPTRYQFTGREYDGFSGFHFYRARWYDSKLGRFMSEDPIGFKGGDINLYGYVLNAPVRFNDPWGTQRADRDRPGDSYSGMREPYKPGTADLRKDIACPLDGYNPWITLDLGGVIQFGPLGGADGIVFAFNPLTQELAGYTKLMSGVGGSSGILAAADAQLGISLGPAEGSQGGGTAAELWGDASAFGGGSGSVTFSGGPGAGIGFGPTIGGGAAGGLRIGETTPLFSINKCECRK